MHVYTCDGIDLPHQSTAGSFCCPLAAPYLMGMLLMLGVRKYEGKKMTLVLIACRQARDNIASPIAETAVGWQEEGAYISCTGG